MVGKGGTEQHRATTPIRVVVTFTLLLLIFGLLVTPIGLLGRLFGRDPLQRREPDPTTSLWQPAVATDADPEGPFRPS